MSSDWIRSVAGDLDAPISDEAIDRVLGIAAMVAHATERKNAPLATYLAGRCVERAVSGGATVEAALLELRERLRARLPEAGR
jgi:hypothetical protein